MFAGCSPLALFIVLLTLCPLFRSSRSGPCWRSSDDRSRDCATVDAIASAHLTEIDRKLADLSALRREIAALVETCPGGTIGECRILDALGPGGFDRSGGSSRSGSKQDHARAHQADKRSRDIPAVGTHALDSP